MSISIETTPETRRVERAIRYLARNRLEQPSLEDVADVMGLSPFHAQRVFSGWVGVSPKQFLGLLTVEHAKALLRDAESVLGAALEVGLSGPSRLHDLFVKLEAITPGEYKAEGQGLTMRWGIHPTPSGDALFVASPRGLARLAFLAEEAPGAALAEAREDWPLSRFVEDPAGHRRARRQRLRQPRRRPGPRAHPRPRQGLAVPGPGVAGAAPHPGRCRGELRRARQGHRPARGVARRRHGLRPQPRRLPDPCHRVIRETGALGGYHWGLDLKRTLLATESATAA